MKKLKKHQEAISIDEQLANLWDLGLVIDDEIQAKETLNSVSYYRLIKAYSIGLKNDDGTYKKGVSFSQITSLYKFNSGLRQILFPIIEDIETIMRCQIANRFCLEHGVLAYKDSSCFISNEYHSEFLEDLDNELYRNRRNPFVRNFRENYIGGDLPFYALVEILSFGDLSKFYKNMLPQDKKYISITTFGIGYTFLESWLESIAYVRNICAHYGRLYNALLSKSPKIYDQYKEAGIPNNRLFAVLLCLQKLCIQSDHWGKFVDNLMILIQNYPFANLSTMGFPNEWQSYLFRQ